MIEVDSYFILCNILRHKDVCSFRDCNNLKTHIEKNIKNTYADVCKQSILSDLRIYDFLFKSVHSVEGDVSIHKIKGVDYEKYAKYTGLNMGIVLKLTKLIDNYYDRDHKELFEEWEEDWEELYEPDLSINHEKKVISIDEEWNLINLYRKLKRL